MKIFGKRKKKVSEQVPAAAPSKNSSDKVVQELLKLDPSEWNAKQRRMVKRFKERTNDATTSNDEQVAAQTNHVQNMKGTANSSSNDTPAEMTTTHNDNVQDLKEKEEELKETRAKQNGSEEESSDSEQSRTEQSPPAKTAAGSKAKTVVSETGASNASSSEHAKEKLQDRSEEQDEVAMNDSNSDKEKVLELIQGLNSKQRRKFMRQLERDGDGALEQVHKEALALTRQKEEQIAQSETDIAMKQQELQKPSNESLTKQRQGKKRKKDWSDLPPEERFRREEQRRLQKEAAERRANGIVSLKKHPLNSERRRANRRKPKWASHKNSIPENEHNSSGYHMRKIKKTMQT